MQLQRCSPFVAGVACGAALMVLLITYDVPFLSYVSSSTTRVAAGNPLVSAQAGIGCTVSNATAATPSYLPSTPTATDPVTGFLFPILTGTSREFSTLRCLHNGRNNPLDSRYMFSHTTDEQFNERRCLFKNLCFDSEAKQWQYFRDPADPDEVLFTGNRPMKEFPSRCGVVNLKRFSGDSVWTEGASIWGRENVCLLPTIINGTIPAHAYWDDAAVSALFEYYHLPNYGHVLGDDIFPLYVLMRDFGVLVPDPQLISVSSCNTECKFSDRFAPYLSSRQLLAQADLVNKTGGKRLYCTRSLLAGSAYQGMHYRGDLWGPFIDYMAASAKVGDLRPTEHRIVILKKKGRRTLINADAIAQHVAACFPAVTVDVYTPGSMSLPDEIRTARSVSVLLTTGGAMSFFGPWLAPGAAQIHVELWNPVKNHSAAMEEFVNAADPRLKFLTIPVYPENADCGPHNPADPPYAQRAHYAHASYTVDPVLAALYVNTALRYAHYGLGFPGPHPKAECSLNWTRST